MNEHLYAWPKFADNTHTQPNPAKFQSFFQSEKKESGSDFSSLGQLQANTAPEEMDNELEPAPLQLLNEKITALQSTIEENEQQLASQSLTINLFNKALAAQNAHISNVSKQILLQVLKEKSPNMTMGFNPTIWLHALECLKEKISTNDFTVITHSRNISNVEIQAQKLFLNRKYTVIADESLPFDEIHVEYQESRTAVVIADICDQLVKIIEESE